MATDTPSTFGSVPLGQGWVEVSPANWQVGTVMPYTVHDENGMVLLSRGLPVDSPAMLAALQARDVVYVDQAETLAARKRLVTSLPSAAEQNVALKDLGDYAATQPAPLMGVQPAEKSPEEQCDELEARLRVTLGGAAQGRWMGGTTPAVALSGLVGSLYRRMERQPDEMLLVLTYRGVTQLQGYSVLHALHCGGLAVLLGPKLKLPPEQTRSLVGAALSMNVAMTSVQDTLALQKQPLTPAQRQTIEVHPANGVQQLQNAGVQDKYWLAIVQHHHRPLRQGVPFDQRPPLEQLVHTLQVLDKFTASMSQRATREGRAASAAARAAILQGGANDRDAVGMALVELLGLYPPGTFVTLETGETALVLRKGRKATTPWVATVLNRRGEPLAEPRLFNTLHPGHTVQGAVSAAALRVRVNLHQMVKLLAFSRTAQADR